MSPLTFAIGDVHGCFDMLQSLLGACEAHSAGRPARYVFLGDYIDRGPDSRGVIQLLMRRQQAQPGTSVCLRGNHEQMAIGAHESALALSLWLQYGGRGHPVQLFGHQWPDRGLPSRVVAHFAVLLR